VIVGRDGRGGAGRGRGRAGTGGGGGGAAATGSGAPADASPPSPRPAIGTSAMGIAWSDGRTGCRRRWRDASTSRWRHA